MSASVLPIWSAETLKGLQEVVMNLSRIHLTPYMMSVINTIHDGHNINDPQGEDAYEGDDAAAYLLDGGGDPSRRHSDRTARDYPWESGHQACSTAPARSQ